VKAVASTKYSPGEDEEPVHRFLSRFMYQFWLVFVRPAYILLKVANRNAVDNPHSKMPVKPSRGPNKRHSFGSSKSP
jgi:hypothetical protein